MISRTHWAPSSDVTVQRVGRSEAGGWVVAGTLAPKGICPDCGSPSRRRHGWRHRRIQDFPAHGAAVVVELRVCRWQCSSSGCSRGTFSDHVPSIAPPFTRRMSHVAQVASLLGHATAGRPAERLLHRLGIRISDDTILRQPKRDARERAPPARVISIDDWSWRKSQTYGTVIIDLERRTVLDVLEDRDVVTCTKWLRRHPEVEVISRDRCGLYAQAARQGAPQAVQVADRFHIVQNLRMAIEEQMNLHGRTTGRALLSDADNISTASHLLRSRLAQRKSREEIFTTIHALRQQELSCSEIQRRTGFPRRSVAKWLEFETPPDRRRAALKPTSPWYFEEFLSQCWKDGTRTGSALFQMIRDRGYEGSLPHLQRLLAGWRRAKRQAPNDQDRISSTLEPIRDSGTGHAISPVIAAALCMKPRGKLSPDQARKVDALKAGSHAFLESFDFSCLIRGKFPSWFDAERRSDDRGLRGLFPGLELDQVSPLYTSQL